MLKITFIICGLVFLSFRPKQHNSSELFMQIENQGIIKKPVLEKLVPHKFEGYEDKFIGTGDVVYSGNIEAGIIQGIKLDTIYDILIVCKGDSLITCRENPNSSFHRKDGTIIEEYRLGRIYTMYTNLETHCIMTHIEKIKPFRTDTLKYEFLFEL